MTREQRTELPEFEDPEVQVVYECLCDDEAAPPNPEEHWEGYAARRIIAKLRAAALAKESA